MASTPDRVTAPPPGEGGTSKYAPHSEGTALFVCVDVIDLGRKLDTFPGKAPRLVPRVALVFASGERHQDDDRSLVTVQQEFALSTYETSKLRKFVEGWYGKTFTDDQLKDGFALHKLVGRPIQLTIEHRKSQKGRAYAVIKSQSPLVKGMAAPPELLALTDSYERGSYWAGVKEAYRTEAEAWEQQQKLRDAMPVPSDDDDFPPQLADDDDDLPF